LDGCCDGFGIRRICHISYRISIYTGISLFPFQSFSKATKAQVTIQVTLYDITTNKIRCQWKEWAKIAASMRYDACIRNCAGNRRKADVTLPPSENLVVVFHTNFYSNGTAAFSRSDSSC
jgi:hypothetical protein